MSKEYKRTPAPKGVMVRITFEDEKDKERIMDYLAQVAKGRTLGRTIRDIVNDAKKRSERL